ncbi:hypothetical protein GCM10027155_19080 [Acinetobacter apis]|uniref:DNA-binding protein n=1 Tax=Acinetobacter apis TaxID=1229165 RepID=A0A217EIE7_9GAMM|nr:plasmid replication DNA-binding protein [Acinetobacter apis]SNQ30271.1 hypothetical protein SAMN05444584_2260 [Acinetobacter apis]
MAKLSLSEVSKKFHMDRSTIYRAVRNGRLSRSSDGQFDLAEVIRCFGEPEKMPQKIESSKQEGNESTKKLIAHLENEVKKYQEREERLMHQIDRMQALIELKSVAPTTAVPQQDATACDIHMPQYDKTQQNNDNKKNNELNIAENVAVLQQETAAYHTQMLQHATLQNVVIPKHKKRSLFGRVLNAVFDNN